MFLSEGDEQASASSDYGSQGSTGLSSNARDEIVEREIAQKENRAVLVSKTVMFLVLLLFCAAAAAVTYIFTKQGQENDFSTEVSLLLLLALVLALNR
jgi:cation transporter-like permease